MDRYHWLLIFHMAGAFMVVGGATLAAIFNIAALRRERPSEVVVLFRLARVAVASITAGMVVALLFAGSCLTVVTSLLSRESRAMVVALLFAGSCLSVVTPFFTHLSLR